jgi:hypothetical protein
MRQTAKVIPMENPAAEQSVLGAILVRPEVLDQVADSLGPADFYREAHGRIYQAMLDLHGRGEPVDLVSVSALLHERDQLGGVGGPGFLAGLSQQVGFAVNGPYYARIVAKKADLRRKKALAQKIVAACDNGGRGIYILVSEISAPINPDSKTTFTPTTARDLAAKTFNPPRWAIPDLLPDGLTILAGKPKAGKSWLALNLAVAVATGGVALGKIQVEQGEALYLALEDSERRLKDRLERIIPFGELPDTLHFLTARDFPPLHKGGLDALDAWLQGHPQARLVIIDTLARVKPPRGRNQESYDHDTAIIATLQSIAIKHNLALVVVHHTKKLETDDFVEAVSGTFGLTGAADCIAVLIRKDRMTADAVIKITGRDIGDIEKALKFHPDLGSWEILGEAQEFASSTGRQDILLILKEAGPKTPAQLANILDRKPGTIRFLIMKMKESGQIIRNENGEYELNEYQ